MMTNESEQTDAEPTEAGQGEAEPTQAEPTQAEPTQAEPTQAEPTPGVEQAEAVAVVSALADEAGDARKRSQRRVIQGTVISDRMDKTISVREERLVKHPLYGKYVRRKTMYKVHDETNQAKIGDVVEITSSRPLSKTKRWRLVRIVRSASMGAAPSTGEAPA